MQPCHTCHTHTACLGPARFIRHVCNIIIAVLVADPLPSRAGTARAIKTSVTAKKTTQQEQQQQQEVGGKRQIRQIKHSLSGPDTGSGVASGAGTEAAAAATRRRQTLAVTRAARMVGT